jgi:hypothetical protein
MPGAVPPTSLGGAGSFMPDGGGVAGSVVVGGGAGAGAGAACG